MMSRFVPGHLNVAADMLRLRRQILKNVWSMHPEVLLRLWRMWDRPLVGLFTTSRNHKLPIFTLAGTEPKDRGGGRFCSLPPISLICQILNKVQRYRAGVILIAPCGPIRSGFRTC